jgi:hypothetical protein
VVALTGTAESRSWTTAITALATASAVLVAIGGMFLSNRASLNELRATQDEQHLAEQGQLTDRFGKAVDQLGQEGGDKLDVRLGGIYALARIMRDSPVDEPTTIEILCAFIRTHARFDNPATPDEENGPEVPAVDVQSALTVLARRPEPDDPANRNVDLHDAWLDGAHLESAPLNGANLEGVNLDGAYLEDAYLNDAYLNRSHLIGAHMTGAHLVGARLFGADLTSSDLAAADLTDYKTDPSTKLPPGIVVPVARPTPTK